MNKISEMHRGPDRPAHRERGLCARRGRQHHGLAGLPATPAGVARAGPRPLGIHFLDAAIAHRLRRETAPSPL